MSPELWRQLSPYLDQALAIEESEREAWLEDLHGRHPELTVHLRDLLREHRLLAQEQFLEEPVTSPRVEEPPALAGQAIGPYRLLSPIAKGGMGSLWLAERSDGRFERQVAVKFLNLALAGRGGTERFKREGAALGRLSHPNIADLADAGLTPEGQPYLVLEYVDGEHIDQYCARHQLDGDARIRLFLEVLTAVAHAHANLIVHRDIKPSNVMVRGDGRVKLLDFGISKLLEDEGAPTQLTREGLGPMTPEYAAPEQVNGEPITTATDVYGLGVLLYVLLTGQHPAGPGPHSAATLIRAIVEKEPQGLPGGDPGTILAKALKKNPLERYRSVEAFRDDLNRYLKHEPIAARPDSFRYRAGKFVRRNRVAASLAALAAALLMAGVAGILIQTRAARVQADFALRQLARAEAVNDFTEFVLTDSGSNGKALTTNELLQRGEQIARRQDFGDSSRAELFMVIGRQYQHQGESARAQRLLEEAYQSSRGLPEPSVRGRVSCSLASVLARQGEPAKAMVLMREGLSDLPSERQFVADRVYCLLRAGEVSGYALDTKSAIAQVEEALQPLEIYG